MSEQNYDVIIVGGGPGGYVAAIRAAQLGLKTGLVEEKDLGGICLNWGCIPTKALLRSAEVFHTLKHADSFGLSCDNLSFDMEKIVARSRGVSSQLSKGVAHLLKKNKVTVFKARARLAPKSGANFVLALEGEGAPKTLTSKNVILATGARARDLSFLPADGQTVWNYRQAMVAAKAPESLLVIGSGAIGVEFASFYTMLGCKVTIVEALDRILPNEDAEISALAHKAFQAQGMTVYTKTQVTKASLTPKGADVTLTLEDGKSQVVSAQKVIVAVGIVGNTEDLGLEATKAVVDRTHIVVDALCQTAEPGLYAIGDIAGPPWLAHKASHEGVMVAEHLAGRKVHPFSADQVPGCTYSVPQVASLGFTEAQALAKGYKIKVGRFPFMGNGKAIALGESEGLVKTIFDEKTGELLGAHMIGAEVTELIQGYAIARTCEATEAELMHTIFPHPTLSEMMHESVLAAFGQAIHI